MSQNSLLVLGMMSGTSADGIDSALVKISGIPPKGGATPNLKIQLLRHTHQSFPPAVRKEILRVGEQHPLAPAEFSQLHARLGQLYAEAALAACKKFRVSPNKIDLIGNHGQTIFHQGTTLPFLGAPTASTLQLGDGSIIANRTGITTVSDFRPADMAVGGQGAPLVPFADYLLYRHPKLGRVSLNLGGIANITVLPAGARPQDVFAFDTGPANILIDALVQHFTRGRRRFDKNATFALRGHINNALIYRLMKDPYFRRRPPKSTGREYFGARFVADILQFARKHEIRPADVLYTVTYFTAESIVDALRRFVLPWRKISQVILSGGGARNPLLVAQLKTLLEGVAHTKDSSSPRGRGAKSKVRFSEPIELVPSTYFGIPAEAKEALAFALLAYETFHQRPSNLPSATGARRSVILGKISYA